MRRGDLGALVRAQARRIVLYRRMWLTEKERADGLQRQLDAAMPIIAEHVDGWPMFVYTPLCPDGVWAGLTSTAESLTTIPALIHPPGDEGSAAQERPVVGSEYGIH